MRKPYIYGLLGVQNMAADNHSDQYLWALDVDTHINDIDPHGSHVNCRCTRGRTIDVDNLARVPLSLTRTHS